MKKNRLFAAVTAAALDRVDFTYQGEGLSFVFDGQTWTFSE